MDATYMELMVRLTLAMVLGGAIGIEREYRAKEAGFRTHFLVALGSALFCVVSQYGFGVDLNGHVCRRRHHDRDGAPGT